MDPKARIEARYDVVTLLYRGKLDAAKLALDGYAKDQMISAHDEAYYRLLLADALRERVASEVVT